MEAELLDIGGRVVARLNDLLLPQLLRNGGAIVRCAGAAIILAQRAQIILPTAVFVRL